MPFFSIVNFLLRILYQIIKRNEEEGVRGGRGDGRHKVINTARNR